MPKNKIIFLVGPTAVGKTKAAVCLAKKLGAEIISCDSMQIYKGMDIVASIPEVSLLKKIPHHLIRCIKPDKEYNVAKYRIAALTKIKEVFGNNKIPLLVGGTGHYMSILVDGIFKAKSENKIIRNRLYGEATRLGNEQIFKRLQKIDPIAAAKIHPNDTKRVIRALEVFAVTGKPISELQKQRKGLGDEYDIKIFCLNMPRSKLYKRIDARVDKMFRLGLLNEVKGLLKSKLSRTASYAIGIRELKGYLDGLYSLDEAKQLMKRNTRLYAKRQLTWFRKDKRIEWIEVSDKGTPASLANRIFQKIKKGS